MSYKITRQQALERAPLLKAWGEGAKLQYRHSNRTLWTDCSEYGDILSDTSPGIEYRIKPTPTLRPWRPEEVPVGALIRFDKNSIIQGIIQGKYLIIASDKTGIVHCNTPDMSTPTLCKLSYEFMLKIEHSLDHGKTWLPCGVLE